MEIVPINPGQLALFWSEECQSWMGENLAGERPSVNVAEGHLTFHGSQAEADAAVFTIGWHELCRRQAR